MITLKAAWADIRISTYAMRYFFYNFSLPVYTCGWVLFWFRSLRADDSASVFLRVCKTRFFVYGIRKSIIIIIAVDGVNGYVQYL